MAFGFLGVCLFVRAFARSCVRSFVRLFLLCFALFSFDLLFVCCLEVGGVVRVFCFVSFCLFVLFGLVWLGFFGFLFVWLVGWLVGFCCCFCVCVCVRFLFFLRFFFFFWLLFGFLGGFFCLVVSVLYTQTECTAYWLNDGLYGYLIGEIFR